MDITSDTLTRLAAKLDACDLADDEHAALIALLTHDRSGDADVDEVSGFVSGVPISRERLQAHDRYANQEVSYLRSTSFGDLLPKLGAMGFGGTFQP